MTWEELELDVYAISLMLASSGLDGMYLSRLMQPWVLGYILNTAADITSVRLARQYARFQADRSPKKRRRAWVILFAEVHSVLFSWFFSWRQLRLYLQATALETELFVGNIPASSIVAFVTAWFVPILLALVGYCQGLRAGRYEDAPVAESTRPQPAAPPPVVRRCACGFEAHSKGAWANHCRWCEQAKKK